MGIAADAELETVLHAYGIVPGGRSAELPATGVGGAGVAQLEAGPVAAIFSILPEAGYGATAWQAHADDPRWLAEVATQHQEVLGRVIQDTDVLPLRLPAMYRDEAALHHVLTTESKLFEAALGAIHDHVEWGVQIFLVDEPTPAAGDRPTTGREFLRQRSEAGAARERAREQRQVAVAEAYAAVAEIARQSVANEPQDPALSGRREPMLLNSAHLVCRRHRGLFFAALDEVATRIGPQGLSVEVSGPWPPYNFVELGAEELEVRR